MFKHSRNKIVLSIMSSVIIIFIVTLGMIVLSGYREIWKRQREMLGRYVSLYTLGKEPGSESIIPTEDNLPPIDNIDYHLTTFYSVALDSEGNVLAVDDGRKNVYSREELVNIAKKVVKGSKNFGRRGSLAYFVEKRDGYTLAAFMDNTLSDRGMETMLHYAMLAGGPAIVALFAVSYFLSKYIVRPLEENDKKQRQFISDAGHELKTPVAIIKANGEMLLKEGGESTWLSNILYENERMGELIKQLLILSRTESAKEEKGVMKEIDFSHLVNGEVLAFESLAFERGKAIESYIEEDIVLCGDKTQLSQLISILLDNALSYSTGRKIEISLKRQKHRVMLEVINEGKEISKERARRLFDRFYRVDEARTGKDHHYGLGLSIAKAAVKNHSGSINVSCMEGRVYFTVLLPVNN